MYLKGHTKIQLFDAKTNKLIQEVNEDNMITNAVSNMLNVPYEWMIDTWGSKEFLEDIMPIKDKSMAGILLFENNIAEDVNNVLPNINNKAIGHAGSAYSGTNIYRGTLNSNESVALENGQRLVQDFSTDKANGIISCVCLTSQRGGDIGVDENPDEQRAMRYLTPIKYTQGFESNTKFIGVLSDSVYCLASISESVLTLFYITGFNPNKINLYDSANNDYNKNVREPIKISLVGFTSTASNTYNNHFYVDKNGILKGCCKRQDSNTKINYIDYFKVNIITGEKIISKEVVPSGISNRWDVIALLEKYIICKVLSSELWRIVILDYNGSFVKDLGLAYNNEYGMSLENIYDANTGMFQIDPRSKTGVTQWINEDGDLKKYVSSMYSQNTGTPIVWSQRNIYPYYINNFNSGGGPALGIAKFDPYLASINNLATAVTKTSSQTMKITYDITQEEG